jgi:small-conductance mechanosensitive channel
MTVLFTIIEIVIKIAIAYVIHLGIKKAFHTIGAETKIHMRFFKNILVAIVWTIATVSVASQFETFSNLASTVLAGSGIVAIVLGLAAQQSFANIFSGLMISIFKPFNIGDRITIVGQDKTGFVEDITLRHTVIRTYTNVRVIVPNSVMDGACIENSSYTKGASYPIDVTIAYEDRDKRYRAMEILEEIVVNHPMFFDTRTEEQKAENIKPVTATCTGFGSSGINLRVLMWTEDVVDNNKACSDCRVQILDRFEAEGIEIPYDKLTLVPLQTENSTTVILNKDTD